MLTHKQPFSERFDEINWWLVLLIGAFCLIGMVMMMSAGGGHWKEFAGPQFGKLVLGIALMFAVAITPMKYLFRYAYLIYAILLAMLIAVDVIGHIGMGAQRWIKFAGVNVQPSEFMKLAVILAFARFYHNTHPDDVSSFRHLLVPLLLLALPAVLILRQPNLGTATVTACVGVALMFFAGVRLRYFIGAVIAAAAAMPIAWHFLHDYQKRRVMTFLDPEQDPLGAGYNILQSQIAIGSGGFWGKGYLHGSQGQLNFLPEKHTDFIFTMFAEEWGFSGSFILLIFYAILLLTGTIIIARSKSVFGRLIAAGITAMIFVHVFINIAMVMGMVPVVGLPLPFLSYGGSIMLAVMIGMGLLLNAYANKDKPLLLSH